jgi:Fe-S cluster assembly protein SufD
MSELLNSTEINIIHSNGFEGVLNETLKSNASSVLETIQFPTTRTEAWKYTRLGKISNKKFNIQKGIVTDISKFEISKEATTIVFVNGFIDSSLSSKEIPTGVEFKSITNSTFDFGKNVKLENEIFNSLNTRFATDGFYIHIKSKTVLEKPLQVIHILTGEHTVANLRNVIICEKNSQAEIIQGFFTENAKESFTNVVTEIFVEENAHLTLNKIQYEDESCYQIATEQVDQHKNSTFKINTITLNGALVRNNLNIEVNGENCSTHLNGAYLLKGNQHVDNHTLVDHKVAHCESHELYKGVVNDKATAVFNGKVFVRKDAQKINAFQSNANVLLSDDSSVNSKPELEIYADDVKCSHGSTTGQLDEEAVFYLRARGLSEKTARKLMISAFINDVIEKIENEEVNTFVIQLLQERFDWEK